MKIFKFGGASVKDAESVKNVASILSLYKKEQLIVVVSAMGKMTNALEKVVHAYYNQDPELKTYIDEIRNFHFKIVDDLGFPEITPYGMIWKIVLLKSIGRVKNLLPGDTDSPMTKLFRKEN